MMFTLALLAYASGWECRENHDQEILQVKPVGRSLVERGSTLSPIRIHFEYLNVDLGSDSKTKFFQEEVMESVREYLSSVLSVYPVNSAFRIASRSCSNVRLPLGDYLFGVSDTDLIFYISTDYEPNQDFAITSTPCFIDAGALNYPVAGIAILNSAKVSEYSFEKLFSMMMHAVTHTLGFSSTLFQFFNKNLEGEKYTESDFIVRKTIRGVERQLLAFPTLVEHARTAFDCPSLQGVELEDFESGTSLGSHWDKRIVNTEFMIGHATEESVFSTLTFAVLKDSLWYDVNFEYLQTPIFGRSEGCEFHTTECIIDGEAQFKEFCDKEGPQCGYYHTSKGECSLQSHPELEDHYQYFEDPTVGGDTHADYCPIVEEIEGGDCRFSSNVVHPEHGETTGANSRCFMTSLVQKGYEFDPLNTRTGCFEVLSCSSESASVRIGNLDTGFKTIECPFTGLQATWEEEYNGYLECPSYDILCSDVPCLNACYGSGKCKKGLCECNEGKFGIDCRYKSCLDIPGCTDECDEMGKCKVCKPDFFLQSGECRECQNIEGCKINCDQDGGCKECESGYFKKNSICKSCSEIEGCLDCNADGFCNECSSGYFNTEGKCFNCIAIEGCIETCNQSNACEECIESYYNDEGTCKECRSIDGCSDKCSSEGNCEECLDSYYRIDGKCYACSTIAGCSSVCSSDGACLECMNGYYVKEGKCYSCDTMTGCSKDCSQDGKCNQCLNDFYNDNGECKLCSTIEGCSECDHEGNCLVCAPDYFASENVCIKCINLEGCTAECSIDYNCEECLPGYYKVNGQCSLCPIIEGCASECDFYGKCTSCMEKYYNIEGNCIECTSLEGCSSDCVDPGYCNTCLNTYYNNEGKCELCTNIEGCSSHCGEDGLCLTCLESYYNDHGRCKDCREITGCSSNCNEDGSCNECLDGYFNDNGTCKDCTSIEGCTSECDSQGKCLVCEPCHTNESGVCSKCEKCLETTGTCCEADQFISDDLCQNCQDVCETCDNGIECTSCKYSGTAPVCCQQGEFYSEGNCLECNALCSSCNNTEECLTCKYAGIAPICCLDQQFYIEGVCVNCAENTNSECIPLGNYYSSSELVESIEFNHKFTKLMVKLKETPTMIGLSNLFDCSYYFVEETVEKLGSGPVCQYSSLRRSIEVTLGYNYSIRKGDKAYLDGFHIQKSTQGIDRNYKLLFAEVQGGSYPIPQFTIRSPSTFNKQCITQHLTLSSIITEGMANSDLKYSWSVDKDIALSNMESSSLIVPVSILPANEYTFSLQVTNAFGNSSTNSMNIVESSGLSVSFDTGDTISVFEDSETVKVKPIANECGETYTYSYFWEEVISDTQSNILGTNKKLIISKGSLKAGSSTTYKCTVTSSNNQGHSLLHVSVPYSSLKPIITPTNTSVSNGLDLVVDGSQSYDPNGKEINYKWSCKDRTNKECTGLDDLPLISIENSTRSSFVIEKERLRVDDKLNVELTVSADVGERSSSTSSELTVIDGGSTEIKVYEYSFVVASGEDLIIELGIENGSEVNWTQLEGPPLLPSSLTTLPSITFAKDTMEEGKEYTFLATVESQTKAPMEVFVTWTINTPPQCDGELKIDEIDGEFYTITMDGCFDSDQDNSMLYYLFGMNIQDQVVPLTYPSFSNTMKMWLAPGTESVSALVCDDSFSCTENTLQIDLSRRLQAEIEEEFQVINTEEDMVPFAIIQWMSAYTVNESNWEFLVKELETHFQNILKEDQSLGNIALQSIIAVTNELNNYAFSLEQSIKILEFSREVIDHATDKLNQDILNMIMNIFETVIENHYESDPVLLTQIIETQRSINRNLIKNTLPGSEAFKLETQDYFSVIKREFASKMLEGFELEVKEELKLTGEEFPFSDEDLIDIEFVHVGSSNIFLAFSRSGAYNEETLELNFSEELSELKDLDYSVSISLSARTEPEYKHTVYTLQDEEWKKTSVKVNVIEDGIVVLQTHSPATFRLESFVPVPEISTESSWSPWVFYFAGISLIMLALLIISMIKEARNNKDFSKVVSEVNIQPQKDFKISREPTETIESKSFAVSMPEAKCHFGIFFQNHLILGLFYQDLISLPLKSLIVWLSVVLHMTANGVLITELESSEEFSLDAHFKWVIMIPIVSLIACGSVILFIEKMIKTILKTERRFLNCIVLGSAILLIASCYSLVFVLYVMFSHDWIQVWCICFTLSIAADFLFLQSLFASSKTFFSLRNTNV